MSCNGCRVLRKGCNEACVLRPCLQWIPTAESQGHATIFVSKFFGRAGLMSFISNVSDSQRPALFRSLLYEACGRAVNPVSGAVGLLWTGNWRICQAAVETVLCGGTLCPAPEFLNGIDPTAPDSDDAWEVASKTQLPHPDLILLKPDFPVAESVLPGAFGVAPAKKMRRSATPSLNSEESGTTISFQSGFALGRPVPESKLLNLFV